MRIGEHDDLPPDQALDILRRYAKQYHGTVLWYDLAGDEHGHPGPGGAAEPVNRVALADIGRLVIINAGLRANDVPLLLGQDLTAEFTAVPPGARLEDWAPGNSLDSVSTALYDRFRLDAIGPAKRSKLLHLKRPWLVPIHDSHVERVYKNRAAELGAQIGDVDDGWWEAIRRDLVDGARDFVWLSDSLRNDDDSHVRRAGKLTGLRLLDILVWELGSQP
jgi:hypothetical protein